MMTVDASRMPASVGISIADFSFELVGVAAWDAPRPMPYPNWNVCVWAGRRFVEIRAEFLAPMRAARGEGDGCGSVDVCQRMSIHMAATAPRRQSADVPGRISERRMILKIRFID